MTEKVKLARFIQQQRIQQKLTQEEAASALGLTRPTYRQIETGERDLRVMEARRLAGLFRMPVDELLHGDEGGWSVTIEKPPAQKRKSLANKIAERSIQVSHKDAQRFKEILLYILGEVGAKPNVGATVLHKLLYFIDFDYYEIHSEKLLGATYTRDSFGPYAVELDEILENMLESDELDFIKHTYQGHTQKKYLPLRDPDLSDFSAPEILHVSNVLARLSYMGAREIADYSHGDYPFRATKQGEIIDYETVFYRDDPYARGEHLDIDQYEQGRLN